MEDEGKSNKKAEQQEAVSKKNSKKVLKKETEDSKKKDKKLKIEKTSKKETKNKTAESTWLGENAEATTDLLKTRLRDAAFVYLKICNDRYKDIHVEILIRFHQCMCSCIDSLIGELFQEIASGKKTTEEAEQYVQIIQGRTFGLLMPTVKVIQGMTSIEEADQFFSYFKWMEKPDAMRRFFENTEGYQMMNEKLEKLLSKRKKKFYKTMAAVKSIETYLRPTQAE